jgi:arylsulfatase A-like enzyme
MTDAYISAVESADQDLGKLMQELIRLELNDEIVIVVTSDHGGKDFGHGGESKEEKEVPFIISGPGIKQNYEISRIVYAHDIPVTVTKILGYKAKSYHTGYPITEVEFNKEY